MDSPTIITSDNTFKWYNSEGQLHRENGPAIIYKDGTREWYIHGQLTKVDGPEFNHKLSVSFPWIFPFKKC